MSPGVQTLKAGAGKQVARIFPGAMTRESGGGETQWESIGCSGVETVYPSAALEREGTVTKEHSYTQRTLATLRLPLETQLDDTVTGHRGHGEDGEVTPVAPDRCCSQVSFFLQTLS